MNNPIIGKKQLTDENRSLICKKFDDGKTPKQISYELEINYKTIVSVIALYKTTGRILAKHRRPTREKKIKNEGIILIQGKIEEDVSVSLWQLKNSLHTELGIDASLSTINNTISSLNYSFKRVELVPQQRNVEGNVERRIEYCSNYLCFDEDKIIFLDEFGVSCSSRQKYGRSLVNTTPRKVVRAIRTKNISVLAAVSKRRLMSFNMQDQAYRQESFSQFVLNLLNMMENQGLNNFKIIMDNASIHKSNELKQMIELKEHELIFLPPYSPQLNPIEELFSKWKGMIKSRNANTREELFNAINETISNITESDCLGYFNHVREFAIKGVLKAEF